MGRICQEVRFRGEAIRRQIGPGSAPFSAVLASLPVFVRAAQRRLRPIVEDAGVLAFPRRGSDGEAAFRLRVRSDAVAPGTDSAQQEGMREQRRALFGFGSLRNILLLGGDLSGSRCPRTSNA
jgi:hypothetical protein